MSDPLSKNTGADRFSDRGKLPGDGARNGFAPGLAEVRQNDGALRKTTGFIGADQSISVWADDGGAMV
jgi:hypothetical protein